MSVKNNLDFVQNFLFFYLGEVVFLSYSVIERLKPHPGEKEVTAECCEEPVIRL